MRERKLAIITGADGGMGTEITRAVAQQKDYDVIMLCYTQAKGEERRDQLIRETGNPNIEVLQVDLSSMASVTKVADELIGRRRPINLLMNNAGTLSRNGLVRTEEGLEYTVAVNYLGPVMLTYRLVLRMEPGSRIVNMVSCTYALGRITPHFFTHGGEGRFWRIPVYSNTKLALWLFTRTLAYKMSKRAITVNAADPGVVSTDIIHMDMWFDPLTDLFFRPCIRTPKQGAATAISLLLDEKWRGVNGGMFASCRQRKLKEKYLFHPQEQKLWEDTLDLLRSFDPDNFV